MAFNKVQDRVYIRDERFEWLPAIILNLELDRALVRIDLPNDWKNTTIVSNVQASNRNATADRVDGNRGLDKDERWVLLKDYYNHRLPLQNARVCRDMAELKHLHEAAILYQIKERHCRLDKPYTRVGEIIVAVNPCRWIHSLYSPEQQQFYVEHFTAQRKKNGPEATYEEKKDDEAFAATSSLSFSNSEYERLGCEPHIYEVSSLAFRGLSLDRRDQTIIVSGESGAGKTESVKIVLQHLATLRQEATLSGSKSDDDLINHLLESSPIFEAFGNAKTLRNNNSSRFGKVTKLHYSSSGSAPCLVGSSFDTYLLETNRVVSHLEGERNFHIFYQLLSAPSSVKIELLGPDWSNAEVKDFHYLNKAESSHNEGVCEGALWKQTLNALHVFGWDGSSLQLLMRALGIVLLIGNISFAFDGENDEDASITNQADLNILATYLGISVDELELAFTQRTIKTAQDLLLVPYTPDQAKEASEALAKALYSGIFASIVRQINILTSAPPAITGKHKVISLVDIFGFENFGVNRFEQLCVNYANERLQQKYALDHLRRHMIEYEAEGIALPNWRDVDNSNTVDLFEGPSGLITTLNEQCMRPNGSSEVFVFKVKHSNKNHGSLVNEKLQLRTEFGVKHFAGIVTYDAMKFVERNMDKLPDFLICVAATSSNGLIAHELGEIMKDNNATSKRKKKATHRTLIDKFSRQLKDLLASIDKSQTRYIRCIKPCEAVATTKIMDHQSVLRQLKCAGLVTAIELSRENFPNKLPFTTVEQRFTCLLPSDKLLFVNDMEIHDKVQLIMSILFSPFIEQYGDSEFAMPFACGNTKVFFRAGALEALETQRQERFATAASRIQQSLRKAVKERQFHRARMVAVRFQALYRSHNLTTSYKQKRRSATKIQACTRGAIYRARFLLMKDCATDIQMWYRAVLTFLQYRQKYHAATRVTTWSRMQLERTRFHRTVFIASMIQARIRAHQQRKRFSEIRRAAAAIGSWWKAVDGRLCYIRMKEAAKVINIWSYKRLLRCRYCRVKSAIILMQARIRSRRLTLGYHMNKKAAQIIVRWAQAVLARHRYKRVLAAATVTTVWTRARIQRANFTRQREAAITVTAWIRSQRERNRFNYSKKAANKVCARRRSRRNSRFNQENCAAVKLQARFRCHQQMKRYNDMQRFAKTKRIMHREHTAATKFRARVTTNKHMQRYSYALIAAETKNIRLKQKESLAAVRLQSYIRSHQHSKRYKDMKKAYQSTMVGKYKEAGHDTSRSLVLSEIKASDAPSNGSSIPFQVTDGTLAKTKLLEQVELYRRQVDVLNNDILHVTAEAELHNQELEADFEERLAEYEEEVLQLKKTIRCYEEDKITWRDEIAANAENVRNLKTGIRSMQEAHREYLNKVMRAIENANAEHVKALELVKLDRDAKLNAMTAEINKIKQERRKTNDGKEEKRANDVHRLARKLEKLISPDYISAMTQKSSHQSQPMVDYIEVKISAKARKIIYRLEDIAAASCTTSPRELGDDKQCIQGLQQQLVNAYEEIERLHTVRLRADSARKRGYRKVIVHKN